MTRSVALLSGDLDGAVAAALIQAQGVEVFGLAFATQFSPVEDAARRSADQLQIPLRVVHPQPTEYLQLIARPRFGYGKGANPCGDCRLAMLTAAVEYLTQLEGQFVVTGEVLGQKMMGQKRSHLEMLEHHAGIPGRLVRPLSAQLLTPTLPETEGLIDRSQLLAIHGSGRRQIRELGLRFGLTGSEKGAARCRLVDPAYGQRLRAALVSQLSPAWLLPGLFEIRHHEWSEDRGLILLGRNQNENDQLGQLFQTLPTDPTILLATPIGFHGPTVLSVGLDFAEAKPRIAAGLRKKGFPAKVGERLAISDKTNDWEMQLAPESPV
ncbi:hypothetical protein M4951_13510 [Blastopirellula sp. J2-11]|uniref:hypothetical protein n=1 Tax=Blastopirellula sp. J2-11 TaxID=2943192 RepID=UPI0021C66AA9|nr:hypothetical protein [Blastopirellula sp. J2-11]UUO04410.1 hypothetical protein M4951_13510 [Blastopirellula sp. J2-11]